MHIKRHRLYVNKGIQGVLVRRTASYWVACSWGIFCVLAGFPIGVTLALGVPNGPTVSSLLFQTWLDFWPSLLASMLILPIVVWDLLRLSHRFVGPMTRLRNAMRDLAAGKQVPQITFREGDFWCEFAEEFNRLAARMEVAERVADQVQSSDVEEAETVAV